MDPTDLIGPASPLGFPAPYWFLVLFKVLGFTLHMAAMNLWYAGPIIALLMRLRKQEEARIFSSRFMQQMPVIVAYGVNFGIVPLLFIQVAYYKVFYPATIFMAWPWLSIIVFLTVAYYGVYLYAIGLKEGGARMTPFKKAAGWISAGLFIVMGFLFSNAMSLMTNLEAWPEILQRTGIGGAPMGTALNTGDPTLVPRWLMMFGLAITTTAAYIVVDAGLFAGSESQRYKRWAQGFALKLYAVGTAWFAVMASWYVFGTWQQDVHNLMFGGPMVILTLTTAVIPALPGLFILAQKKGISRGLSLATGVSQFVVLTCNAVSRQVVQNAELARFVDVTSEPVNMQWSPLVLFLVLFFIGLGVIIWMVRKIVVEPRELAAGR